MALASSDKDHEPSSQMILHKKIMLEFRIDTLKAPQGSFLLFNGNSRWQFENILANTLFAELPVMSRLDYVMLYPESYCIKRLRP